MADTPFPEFITSRRRELELTLGDVASKLGVSPITVSNWSNGASTPKPENLVPLANLLEVPADDLASMAGVALPAAPEAGVNLMPTATEPTEEADPTTEEQEVSGPIAVLRTGEAPGAVQPEAAELTDEPVTAESASPAAPVPEIEPPPLATPPAADEMDSELAELIEETTADREAPAGVPAFVATEAPEPAAARRRPTVRRPRRTAAAPERPVTTLPLTYIEDPRQLMRYRIRWTLTVVVLAIMFVILLWASGELLSALSEVKQAVTPGGIGGS